MSGGTVEWYTEREKRDKKSEWMNGAGNEVDYPSCRRTQWLHCWKKNSIIPITRLTDDIQISYLILHWVCVWVEWRDMNQAWIWRMLSSNTQPVLTWHIYLSTAREKRREKLEIEFKFFLHGIHHYSNSPSLVKLTNILNSQHPSSILSVSHRHPMILGDDVSLDRENRLCVNF